MLIWGGQDVSSAVSTGGRFAIGQSLDKDTDGFSHCTGDCEDEVATIYPGAPQACDGTNNDCNSPGWPSLAGTNELDDDGDTLTECQGDCDDTDSMIWETPGEVTNLALSQSGGPGSATSLAWTAPGTGGTVTSMLGPSLQDN